MERDISSWAMIFRLSTILISQYSRARLQSPLRVVPRRLSALAQGHSLRLYIHVAVNHGRELRLSPRGWRHGGAQKEDFVFLRRCVIQGKKAKGSLGITKHDMCACDCARSSSPRCDLLVGCANGPARETRARFFELAHGLGSRRVLLRLGKVSHRDAIYMRLYSVDSVLSPVERARGSRASNRLFSDRNAHPISRLHHPSARAPPAPVDNLPRTHARRPPSHSTLPPSDEYTGYYYGADHPMKPQRIAMTHALVLGYGLDEHLDIYVRDT